MLAKVLGQWRLTDFMAVTRRIVHGGTALRQTCLVDDAVEANIERLSFACAFA